MPPPTVFISYSHDSPEHAERVLTLADRLRQEGVDAVLDQYQPHPPEGWPRWMDQHLRAADFVLLVCTETYFRRVMLQEPPGTGLGVKWEGSLIFNHLYQAETINSRFIPVLFEGGRAEHIPTPLQGVTFYRLDTPQGYEALYRRLTEQPAVTKPALGKLRPLPPRQRQPDYLGPKISTAKLPSASPDLFGRETELAALDAAWDPLPPLPGEGRGGGQKTNVLSLVAWGGVGKTALVNKWLAHMAQDNYRGAERVYGWSFYSQGAAEGRQVSADLFIAAALDWFGDPDPTAGSPWDKGERLAELVKRQRTLLILDGLEPLQNPPPVETGKIKDPGLCALLRELARHNPGLVLLTTRLAVDDLKDFLGSSALDIDLDNLSHEAGAAYLAHLGVQGTPAEREAAAAEVKGHALALTLLGRYLVDAYGGDIRRRDLIPHLTEEEEKGAHAQRIMAAYDQWFSGKPEQSILSLLGLFDRPAEAGAIEALLAAPPIDGLTTVLQGLAPNKWQLALKHLRRARLLADPDPHEPDSLDCHPLLREYFGEQVRASNPAAWHEAHSRLYEYYKNRAKDLPDTLAEMTPLFAAVAHGCQAGRHQEALVEVYWQRIQRGGESFNTKKLGALGAELAALAGFFDALWRRPVAGLTEGYKGFVLNEAGLDLRALGRLAEAAQPIQAALDAAIAQQNWENAARAAATISGLYLTSGDLVQALAYARQSVELAERSGGAFERMAFRTTLADTLHQVGSFAEAEAAFRKAEEMQKAQQPEFPLLYSLQGFRYCDLLLSHGRYREVQNQAGQTLEWAKQYLGKGMGLHDIGNDYLSLGRAHLIQAQNALTPALSQGEREEALAQAAAHLERAVEGLRQAGLQEFITRGLLARAELRRVSGSLEGARRDLDEAFAIALRGGMRLHEVDCHLEYARWYLAAGEKDQAQASLARAKEMIADMGYHRRDGEVEELAGQV